MQSLTITSGNDKILQLIKDYISQFKAEVEIKEDETAQELEPDEYYFLNGVKVRKGKGKIDISKLSGSFPDIGLDPETYRKKLWARNKE